MKLKLHLFRITYLLFFFTLVLFTFIRDNHLIASIFGIIFFFNGFYLFYLEKVIEKNMFTTTKHYHVQFGVYYCFRGLLYCS